MYLLKLAACTAFQNCFIHFSMMILRYGIDFYSELYITEAMQSHFKIISYCNMSRLIIDCNIHVFKMFIFWNYNYSYYLDDRDQSLLGNWLVQLYHNEP